MKDAEYIKHADAILGVIARIKKLMKEGQERLPYGTPTERDELYDSLLDLENDGDNMLHDSLECLAELRRIEPPTMDDKDLMDAMSLNVEGITSSINRIISTYELGEI